jgi:hypothetical protein
MPVMIRPEGKPKKIAYAILGTPANMAVKKTAKEKQVDKALLFQETVRVR